MSEQQTPGQPVRRNGNRAACEPCRKSKLRCDHGRPPCGRCIRRGFSAAKCIYHPAPMTQPRQTLSPITAPNPPVRPTSMTVSVSPFGVQSESFEKATSLVGLHGSLGPFEAPDALPFQRTHAALSQSGVSSPSVFTPITPFCLAEAAALLEQLLDYTTPETDSYMMRDGELDMSECALGDGLIKHTAWAATRRMLSELRASSSPDKFRTQAQALFEQTARTFEYPQSPAEGRFEACLSGSNLRWETVGLYSTTLGQGLASAPEIERICETSAKSRALFFMARKCEGYCEQLGQVNDLSLWLAKSMAGLGTWCFGDDSCYVWREINIAVGLVFALNYHRGVDLTLPIYVVQLRLRNLALIHELDKNTATFVGRPPRLSRHYCVIQLPLDITEDELLRPEEELLQIKAELDPNGWKRTSTFASPEAFNYAPAHRLHSSHRVRATMLLTMIREEALELSFAPEFSSFSSATEQAKSILARLTATWHSIPSSNIEPAQWEDIPVEDASILRWMRLDYLYTKFLLLKMLVNNSEGHHAESILVSHEILSLVLQHMRSRKRMISERMDLEYMTVFFGMPCASILLLELYRTSRQPTQTLVLSKSTIIKDISALITCCDWITESGHGNFDLCKRAQALFSRGLEQIFDIPQGQTQQQQQQPTRGGTSEHANGVQNEVDGKSQPMNGVGTSTGPVGQNPTPAPSNPEQQQGFDDFAQDPAWNAWLESFGLEGEQWLDFSVGGSYDQEMGGGQGY